MKSHQYSPETTTLNCSNSACDTNRDSHNLRMKADESKDACDIPRISKPDLEKCSSEVDGSIITNAPAGIDRRQDEDTNIVRFYGLADPDNPMNWDLKYKSMITAILASMTFITTFTSAIFSTAVEPTSKVFHTSTEIMTLGTSLFLLGFGFGPIMWGFKSVWQLRSICTL